jgi:hypothetical protein
MRGNVDEILSSMRAEGEVFARQLVSAEARAAFVAFMQRKR